MVVVHIDYFLGKTMDRDCRVSVDELEHDQATKYWGDGERESELVRLMTDPWMLKKFLVLNDDLYAGLSAFCLNELIELDPCSRILFQAIEEQANNYIDK